MLQIILPHLHGLINVKIIPQPEPVKEEDEEDEGQKNESDEGAKENGNVSAEESHSDTNKNPSPVKRSAPIDSSEPLKKKNKPDAIKK